ncbi:hypothetical protein B0F90DRAFT_1680186 [Multifurca ochricompacta]|uniref:GSKIP domain-containing protein n=1 Tax=Multifurca ochricompacta TaxID=376703 RepID=A0AAD4MDI2_9AGAM|nr:hypothetical protein B0F90DRAFT_1680186 [Multifurca ochricompacta]
MDDKSESEIYDFYRRELIRALNEQSFGIAHSEVTHFAENEARGAITLLEGETINVVLSSAGYQLSAQVKFYETLDDLLSSTSPTYSAKRVEILMARLQDINK